jgi:DNA-binding response OmpR family regulator/S1-C subfamily serine protease
MNDAREKIVVVEADATNREKLSAALQEAGYDVTALATAHEGLEAARQTNPDLLIVDAGLHDPIAREILATIRGSSATAGLRVILLVGAGAEERAAGLDLGANDALSRPFDSGELVARVRAQLRARRAETQLRQKARLAEEGQQIAHTAFEALAVTEKMANDAVSLDRRLKIGFGAVFAVAILMAGIYFLFVRTAHKETLRSNAFIARLEGGLVHQEDLITEARKLRGEQQAASAAPIGKDEVRKPGVESAKISIPVDVQSVCLLHVSVAFRHQLSGRRLRYAGLNPKGEPLQDSDGHPILTLEGNGPEVKLDVFGTGFVAGPNGRVITNRHVAEPWWKNDDLTELTGQGFQAEISLIRAYFPGDPRAFHAEIQQISDAVDLAAMRVDMQDLKRSSLSIDSGQGAAVTGAPIVLMGYATGLAAILARTDEDTAQQILTRNGGDVSQILDELARRNLIHPLITQGHIGDVLPEKIVFDAQTTSGGSGGPLFNQQGKVVGVTYAVLRGFGGSNFGIPIRFSQPLLAP